MKAPLFIESKNDKGILEAIILASISQYLQKKLPAARLFHMSMLTLF